MESGVAAPRLLPRDVHLILVTCPWAAACTHGRPAQWGRGRPRPRRRLCCCAAEEDSSARLSQAAKLYRAGNALAFWGHTMTHSIGRAGHYYVKKEVCLFLRDEELQSEVTLVLETLKRIPCV